MTGKNRIMIYGPKDDGTYVVEFRTADGEALAISIPRTEAHVIRHFQEVSRRSAGSRSDAPSQALPLWEFCRRPLAGAADAAHHQRRMGWHTPVRARRRLRARSGPPLRVVEGFGPHDAVLASQVHRFPSC